MTLGSTQTLIKMSASDIFWCRAGERFRALAQIVYKIQGIISFVHGNFEEQNNI
jgi:hypothetical protein